MSRSLVVALALVVAALVGAAVASRPAEAAGPVVVCTQVPQKPGQLDETFVANFMNEQIGQGRARFQTVQGVSTVLCAW